ncbi:MAG: metallophosphoesterase, partial [Williamsia sp.]|nr:metallophosphoesterase [Williamsia sp.]
MENLKGTRSVIQPQNETSVTKGLTDDSTYFSIIFSSDPQLPWAETDVSSPTIFFYGDENNISETKGFSAAYRLYQNYHTYIITSTEDLNANKWNFPSENLKATQNAPILSDSSPAGVSFNTKVYIAVRDNVDNSIKIFSNTTPSSTSNWNVESSLDGAQGYRTFETPILIATADNLYLAFKGEDNYFNLAMLNSSGNWQRICRLTDVIMTSQPALAILDFTIIVAFTFQPIGNRPNVYTVRIKLDGAVESQNYPNINSDTGVALAKYGNKGCYLAYVSNKLVNIITSKDGKFSSAEPYQIPFVGTDSTPSLASSKNRLCCVYRTTAKSHFFFVTEYEDNKNWTSPIRLPFNRENNNSQGGRDNETDEPFSISQINGTYKSISKLALDSMNSKYPVQCVIVNGDLTTNGSIDNANKYLDTLNYLKTYKDVPYHLGLGNHDIGEQSSSTKGSVYLINKIIYQESQSLIDLTPSKDDKQIMYLTGSLAYQILVNKVLIIQLHNFPSFMKSFTTVEDGRIKQFQIIPDFAYIENLLSAAATKSYTAIICMHDYGTLFKSSNDDGTPNPSYKHFNQLVKRYNVSAVIVGHIHQQYGRHGKLGNDVTPLYKCGSSTYQNYLVVNFDFFNRKGMVIPVFFNDLNDASDYHFQMDNCDEFKLLPTSVGPLEQWPMSKDDTYTNAGRLGVSKSTVQIIQSGPRATENRICLLIDAQDCLYSAIIISTNIYGGWHISPTDLYIACGDIDGDKCSEIVVVSRDANNIGLLKCNKDNGLECTWKMTRFLSGGWPIDMNNSYVACGNISGDAKSEIIVVNTTNSRIGLLNFDGKSGLQCVWQSKKSIPGNWNINPSDLYVACGDIDGDGKSEVIVVSRYNNNFEDRYIGILKSVDKLSLQCTWNTKQPIPGTPTSASWYMDPNDLYVACG